jgi:hypothetical protein
MQVLKRDSLKPLLLLQEMRLFSNSLFTSKLAARNMPCKKIRTYRKNTILNGKLDLSYVPANCVPSDVHAMSSMDPACTLSLQCVHPLDWIRLV